MKRLICNKIKCTHCNDIIESKTVHDYKECLCGACAVDGGLEYLRRTYRNSIDDFVELSEYEDS